MKYCSHCGAEAEDDAAFCVKCGRSLGSSNKTQPAESPIFGILSIVFGALGGWLGLIFGIIGLSSYKEQNNKSMCKIGIGLFIGWMVILFLLLIVRLSLRF